MEIRYLLAVVFLLAGFIQGLTGFGFGMVAMSLSPMLIDIKQANVLVTVLALFNCLFVTWSVRHAVDFKKILPIFFGAFLGVPIGVYLLQILQPRTIKIILGTILIVFSIYSIFRTGNPKGYIRKTWGVPIGILSGILNGLIHMGGPPVIIYTYYQNWDKDVIKATLITYFAMSAAYKVFILLLSKLVTLKILQMGGILLPIVYSGAFLGFLWFARMNQEQMRKITFSLLICLGLLMLFK
jgi:uncharacterized membrane protein YfcA